MLGAKFGFGPSADFNVRTSDPRSAQKSDDRASNPRMVTCTAHTRDVQQSEDRAHKPWMIVYY